jgi:hypothetical protein
VFQFSKLQRSDNFGHADEHGEPMRGINGRHDRFLSHERPGFMAVVVSTKPTQTKNASTTPPRIMTSCQMAHQPREHPGHQEAPHSRDDEGERCWLTVFLPLAKGILPDLAKDGLPAPAHEKSRDGGDDDSEVVDRNGSHLAPPICLPFSVVTPSQARQAD